MSPDQIQAELTELFCPPLDTTLVAAIAHEHGQTLHSAREVCETLAAAAVPDTEPFALDAASETTALQQSNSSAARSSPPNAESPSSKGKCDGPNGKPVTNSRRRQFGGKLTQTDSAVLPASTSSRASGLQPRNAASRTPSPPPTASSASRSPSTTATSDVGSVERLLQEWSLADKSAQDPDNLRLTDEENDSDAEVSSMPAHELIGRVSPSKQSALLSKESDEANRVGALAGDGVIDPTSVAEGQEHLSGPARAKSPAGRETFDPLVFLKHAFPARTPEFLQETLNDAKGDVQAVVDTIMTIDLIEAEDARGATAAEVEAHSSSTATGRRGGGLDYEALAKGIGSRGAIGGDDASLRGKKRRAARKRMVEQQRLASGATPSASSSDRVRGSSNRVKVNLTDVRHGGGIAGPQLKRLQNSADTDSQHSRNTDGGINGFDATGLSDAELAAKLAAEEEERVRDPDADQPVLDNQWLLTSSVLSQLSTLLDVEAAKVTSVYNASSFNLANCYARLVEQESDRFPTLSSLDDAGSAPAGTAQSICDGIAAISNVDTSAASKALRATKGRQDAALDLLQLQSLVRDSVGETDALDPMGYLRTLGNAEMPDMTAEAADAKGFSVHTRAAGRGAAEAFPTPSQAASSPFRHGSGASGGAYSNIVGRKAPGPAIGASAAFRSGSAVASVLPASSTFVGGANDGDDEDLEASMVAAGLASHVTSHDPMRRMAEYRLIAEEYRARRDEALQKAAAAWKSGRGAVRTGGKGGGGGKSGIAWHYADQARRMDAKSRAWSLKASRALVEDRRRGAVGVMRTSDVGGFGSRDGNSGSAASNTIDLHGVTVHEALSIVREQVTRWYASPRTGLNPPPFKIITGVGRHSPHQIAVLRPAIAKMLDREGWRHDVDHSSGIILVRGAR
ncbi:hypothetical protein BCV70DRAFT_199276 [Testicularia cyperi]|uniref:Smr domain-containing protein n=1 Tax=Testicularia cyperi TaxID=1882483 RepID=A0A317XSN1_9BASI|nr:hypothetical protein BCV70DRAFT_199276 [Testicularia cyperi]